MLVTDRARFLVGAEHIPQSVADLAQRGVSRTASRRYGIVFSVPSAARLQAIERPVPPRPGRAVFRNAASLSPDASLRCLVDLQQLDGLLVCDWNPLTPDDHLARPLPPRAGSDSSRRRSRAAGSPLRWPGSCRPSRRSAGCNRCAAASDVERQMLDEVAAAQRIGRRRRRRSRGRCTCCVRSASVTACSLGSA